MQVQPPTFTDVLRARALLANHLPPTPMWSYPSLDGVVSDAREQASRPRPTATQVARVSGRRSEQKGSVGATTFVKHDNVQPTGAFKVRGGVTLLAGMAPAERERGVLTYSTGNHAQSLAYATRLFDVPCVIVMPENPNESKVTAVRSLGASVVLHGQTLDDAKEHAERLADQRGMRLVSAGNEPALVAGVATAYLEVFESVPDLDALFVPVGGGSGAAAACLVASALAPGCRVVGVQSAASPAACESWRGGTCVRRPNRSRVEGLATGSGFELTQGFMRGHLSDFVLVSDDDISRAQRLLLTHAHTLAEGAGAASLAGLLASHADWTGTRVGTVCTGGNASPEEIATSLNAETPIPV